MPDDKLKAKVLAAALKYWRAHGRWMEESLKDNRHVLRLCVKHGEMEKAKMALLRAAAKLAEAERK